MLWKNDPTHRRQTAGLATALLLALSGICAWFGDESDSLVSTGIMDADDEESGYVRRNLLAIRRRVVGHPSKNAAFIANRARFMAAPGCHGVLLTSQGGVGSSAFITAIEHVQMKGASFYTNDDYDADGFKHLPASKWTEHDANGLRRMDTGGDEHCFRKALVIVGDPVHTVESTYRRFRMSHINKLKMGSGLGYYPNSMPLAHLYIEMADTGSDTTGITQYITGWYEASRDRDHWPDIRIVTAKTLFDHAEDHARWIGVEERDMYMFKHMSFDAGRQHRTAPSVSSAGTVEKVMQVFAEAIDLVDAIDEIPYDQGVQPDEESPAMIKQARRRNQQQNAKPSVRARARRNASWARARRNASS